MFGRGGGRNSGRGGGRGWGRGQSGRNGNRNRHHNKPPGQRSTGQPPKFQVSLDFPKEWLVLGLLQFIWLLIVYFLRLPLLHDNNNNYCCQITSIQRYAEISLALVATAILKEENVTFHMLWHVTRQSKPWRHQHNNNRSNDKVAVAIKININIVGQWMAARFGNLKQE